MVLVKDADVFQPLRHHEVLRHYRIAQTAWVFPVARGVRLFSRTCFPTVVAVEAARFAGGVVCGWAAYLFRQVARGPEDQVGEYAAYPAHV